MSQPVLSPSHADRLEIPPPSTPSRPKLNTPRPTSSRLPHPTLFQGPPSRNNSHISLAIPGGSNTQQDHTQQPRASRVPQASSFSGASFRAAQQPSANANAASQNDSERTDAMWAEMQTTLAEVEVSALTSSHVFGASHAKALEELRASQLALAQAWQKSEEGEMADALRGDFDDESEEAMGVLKEGMLGAGSSPSASSKKDKDKKDTSKNLEEETERDILLARKRREANDRYFQQVNRGVLDVVSKLEDVATAMRRVEKESREIWSESDGDAAEESVIDSATEETGTTSAFTNSPQSTKR